MKHIQNFLFLLIVMVGVFCLTPQLLLAQGNGDLDYSQPKDYEIGGITISGTEHLKEDLLIRLSGLEVGDKVSIPGEGISNAIKNLWKQGLFADVKIVASRIVNDVVFLDIQVKERARLSKYAFKGVRKNEEDELRDMLLLRRGRIVDQNLIKNTLNIVSEFYKEKGFLNVTVKTKQRPDENFPNHRILTIDVARGNKIRINEIIFEGNEQVYSRKLRRQMKGTKERTRVNPQAPKIVWKDLKKAKLGHTLGNLSITQALQYVDENVMRFKPFSQSKFLEDKFEEDKDAIIAYYNEKGYRDARIIQDTIWDVNDKSIAIKLSVDEGEQYHFRDISWKGNTKYSDEELNKILGIDKGDIYNQTLLDSRLFMDPSGQDVSALYMDDGYLFFQVTPAEKSVSNDSIDLEINIYEGAQATVNDIVITGNTKTNEHVIRRELRSLPGNKFSRSDIIRSQREIANLGFFDPEQIQITPIPNPQNGTVDIEYGVVEKPSDQLELSAGWGGTGIVGSLGVSFNNFSLRNAFRKGGWAPIPSGDGQRLSLRFQSTGAAFQALTTSFVEPWLGGKKPNALSLSIFSQRICSNCRLREDRREESARILLINGVTLGLGQRLRVPDDNFLLRTDINYQHYNLKNSPYDFIITEGKSNDLSFKVELARYSIDQPIYPRSGSNISLSVQATPPFSRMFPRDLTDVQSRYRWAEYHKWKFKADWFTSIVGNLVLHTSVKTGLMGYYNQDIGHSPFQRFEVGGDGIANNFSLYGIDILRLRGYDRISTPDIGDPFFSKFTVELRYPLSLNPSSTIYALAFAEGGNTWDTFKEYNPFEMRRSVGLGMRIFLPMFGTLGFDYAIGFDKPTVPKTGGSRIGNYLSQFGQFHVVLGQEPE